MKFVAIRHVISSSERIITCFQLAEEQNTPSSDTAITKFLAMKCTQRIRPLLDLSAPHELKAELTSTGITQCYLPLNKSEQCPP